MTSGALMTSLQSGLYIPGETALASPRMTKSKMTVKANEFLADEMPDVEEVK